MCQIENSEDSGIYYGKGNSNYSVREQRQADYELTAPSNDIEINGGYRL